MSEICAWGGGQSSSSVYPLNYKRLDRALTEKKRRNMGHTDVVYVHYPNVTARREDDTIVMKLHATDIIVFYPNGDKVLSAPGWWTPLTKHWLYQAIPVNIYNYRPSKWSDSVWLYTNHGDPVLFYDGMRVNESNVLISERRSMEKKVLSEEGKALQTLVLRNMREHYLPHARMIGADGKGWSKNIPLVTIQDPIEVIAAGEFNLDILHMSLKQHKWESIRPERCVENYVTKILAQEIKRRNLLDEVECEVPTRR